MIIVYDIAVERLNAVRHVMKQYLNWVQNSAFEGEITEGKLEELRLKVYDIIDKDSDSIVVYKTSNPSWVSKSVWGIEKGEVSPIV
ncbi:MAG: CRISPR-associated endonuclease Cas2 [Nitrososphaerales archaeon]